MVNIMKAQGYQHRHDIFSVIVLIVGFVFSVGSVFLSMDGNFDCSMYIVQNGETWTMIWLILVLLLCGRITGWDYNDKTINYELLSGHSRGEIFWARFCTSIAWCLGSSYAFFILALLLSTLIGGWGVNVALSGMLIRILLCAFPLLRMVAEFFLLTIIVRNCYVTYALGYVLTGVGILLTLIFGEMLNMDPSYVTGNDNITMLLALSNYHSETINGVDVSVYSTALTRAEITNSIVVNVVITILCLLVAYKIFSKRDMQ